MPVIVLPYIPSTITVHLGLPDQWAENVTVSFPDYVKNVASSEIYPTWELSAIRANSTALTLWSLKPFRNFTVTGFLTAFTMAVSTASARFISFIRAEPSPLFTIFGTGQPMFTSITS